MSAQPAPAASHRRQRYEKLNGGVPLHAPADTDSVCVSRVIPLSDGSAWFTGGAGATIAVCELEALLEPNSDDAVTRTRIVKPTSSAVNTYDVCVAPEIATQLPPARRSAATDA